MIRLAPRYALCALLGLGLLRVVAEPRPGEGRRGRQSDAPIEDVRFLFKTEVPPHPLDLILGRPTAHGVTASIAAASDGEGRISYAAVGSTASPRIAPFTVKAGEAAEVRLEGLHPDTAYEYRLEARIGGQPYIEPAHRFQTQRAPGAAFTFTVQADPHLDYNTEPALYLRCLENARADRPDFHIDLGDTFMTDKHRTRTTAAAQYVAQRYYFGTIAHGAPLFLVLGNHDGEAGRWLDGTDNNLAIWSNRMRKRWFPNPRPDGFYTGNTHEHPQAGLLEDYYAWEWGDALFVVLDPFWYSGGQRGGGDGWSRSLGRQQYDWLADTLAKSRAEFRFVFLHHLVGGLGKDARGGVEAAPLYEWGGHDPDGTEAFATRRPGWPMPIHDLLVRHGVNIVFHGHDHLYVRQELDGIVYQEVPQPGHPRFDNTRSAEEYGYRSGTLLGSSGHLRIQVAPGESTVSYVRAFRPDAESADRKNGSVAHRYSVAPRSIAR